MERVLTIIMAGGAGERLEPLTRERSKAAVPFGGKYRIIDFSLSNCINSGLRQIFVLTQYRSQSLMRHIQEGWSISNAGLGDFVYSVPAQQRLGREWYQGTADAVRQNLNLISGKGIDDVLILSGDHIYKMDYRQFVAYHRKNKAGLTISSFRVKREEAAGTLGVLETDYDHRLIGFEEKPLNPRPMKEAPDYVLASMGVYIFKVDTLLRVLKGHEEDFGKHIIPQMINTHNDVFTYDYQMENKIADFKVEVRDGIREKTLIEHVRDSSYWRDVGTIDAYYQASMDLLEIDPVFDLYGERWPFRFGYRLLPPTKFVIGGKALESMVSDGCIISGGTVSNSILSPGVIVERNAIVEQSVIFDDVSIEPGARIRRAIIDKGCRIRAGTTIGHDHEADKKRGCTVSEKGVVVVPKETDLAESNPHLF
jgi:glucose-1-phosphate adenylyltransferase